MASVNKVIIVGYLGKDPETRYAPNGDAICNINVATTDSWKDKTTGEKKEMTEWHHVSFFGRLAEVAGQYLHKGSPVYVEGSLRTRKWQDKDGKDRYTTGIRADSMQLLGDRAGGEQRQQPAPQQPRQQAPQQRPAPQSSSGGGGGFADMDDSIPF